MNVQGGQRPILTKGRGAFYASLIVSRDKSTTNYGILYSYKGLFHLKTLQSFQGVSGGINFYFIKDLGGVMLFIIISWGENNLFNDRPGGIIVI